MNQGINAYAQYLMHHLKPICINILLD